MDDLKVRSSTVYIMYTSKSFIGAFLDTHPSIMPQVMVLFSDSQAVASATEGNDPGRFTTFTKNGPK